MVAKRRRHQFQMYSTRGSGMDQVSGKRGERGRHPSWGCDAESSRQKVLRFTFLFSYVSKESCCESASYQPGRQKGEIQAN